VTYLLDANVFIQAQNLHYGLDFCPGFWSWLVEKNEAGEVISIDKVADEINAGQDELTRWVRQQGQGLFRPTDTQVLAQFGPVSDWVIAQNEMLRREGARFVLGNQGGGA